MLQMRGIEAGWTVGDYDLNASLSATLDICIENQLNLGIPFYQSIITMLRLGRTALDELSLISKLLEISLLKFDSYFERTVSYVVVQLALQNIRKHESSFEVLLQTIILIQRECFDIHRVK